MGLDPFTSARDLGLKGPVRNVTVKATGAAAGSEQTYLFDRSGRVIEKIKQHSSGSVVERTIFKYDGSGHLIGYDGYLNKALDYTVATKVGPDGRLTELIRTQVGRPSNRGLMWNANYRHKSDSRGRLVERTMELKNTIQPSGLLILMPGFPAGKYRETFRYDEGGRGFEYVFYMPGPKGEVAFFRTVTKYDPNGRESFEMFPGGFNKERAAFEEFRYNGEGDIVERRNYEPINEATRREVGDRYKVDPGGSVRTGVLISDKPNTVLWNLTQCSYIYDQFKNWTAKACTLTASDEKRAAGDPDGDQQRSIEYYPQ